MTLFTKIMNTPIKHMLDISDFLPFVWLTFLTVAVVVYNTMWLRDNSGSTLSKAPVVGATSGSWLSTLQARLKWTSNGVSMLYQAYEEVKQISYFQYKL